MDPIVVLFVCKVVLLPYDTPRDEYNAQWTHHQPFRWATEHSKMVCKRKEIQVFDQAAAMGADPRPFTPNQCLQTSIMEGAKWDLSHNRYKFWRSACPTPIVDTRSGKIIGWKIPECPLKDGVVCELDITI